MKRIMALIFSLALILGIFSGCKSQENYLIFYSEDSFELDAERTGWTGFGENNQLFVSTDAKKWQVWDGTAVSAQQDKDEFFKVYLRGYMESGTLTAAGDNGEEPTTLGFSKAEAVYCSGNIMTLLNCKNPDEAKMGESAFVMLFDGAENLVSAPYLPATELTDSCYRNMFRGCGISEAPYLPAVNLKAACYNGMFADCENLTITTEGGSESLIFTCPDTEGISIPVTDMFYHCKDENGKLIGTDVGITQFVKDNTTYYFK